MTRLTLIRSVALSLHSSMSIQYFKHLNRWSSAALTAKPQLIRSIILWAAFDPILDVVARCDTNWYKPVGRTHPHFQEFQYAWPSPNFANVVCRIITCSVFSFRWCGCPLSDLRGSCRLPENGKVCLAIHTKPRNSIAAISAPSSLLQPSRCVLLQCYCIEEAHTDLFLGLNF